LEHEDYPALYQSASALSAKSQKAFYRALFWHLLLLFFASVVSITNSEVPEVWIFQALLLIGALACAVYLYYGKSDQNWYKGRAAAESVKTLTWRFVSRAEPFESTDEIDKSKFNMILKGIIEQNVGLAQHLTTSLSSPSISDKMMSYRQDAADMRRERYIKDRIIEQQVWYAKKADYNRKTVDKFYFFLVLFNIAAIFFAIAKVQYPKAPMWPTDSIVSVALSLVSWIQAKRFQELSASYALTAYEIGFIKEQATRAMNDSEFSKFVGDAENAFSREHTQWIARRDA
jgi:hypothetical protein